MGHSYSICGTLPQAYLEAGRLEEEFEMGGRNFQHAKKYIYILHAMYIDIF